jgi:predicted RNA methylase
MEALASHPTVKPVTLVADALLDCTARGGVVLDQFAGSGTILLAAEKVGRIAYAMEYEPRYVDVAVQRWQSLTKFDATLAGDGRTFEELSEVRVRPGPALQSRHSDSSVQPKKARARKATTERAGKTPTAVLSEETHA